MSNAVQTKPKLPGFISLVLVTILGITVAKLMWLVISPKQETITQVQAANGVTLKPKEKINYGKLIANQHLFGVVEVKKTPVAQAPTQTETPKEAPTKLDLTLHGIVSYPDSRSGYALISSTGQPQRVYGKDDELQEGVTITDIFPDKVVIDNHGKSEDLLLPEKRKNNANKRTAASNLSTLPGNNPRRLAKRFNGVQPDSNIDLSAIRQEALSSPQKLLEIATPTPAIVNGKFLGFRVQPGRKRKLFRQLGFRPNDIITEVNGIVLDDYSKGIMVSAELQQANNLSITVKRGSQYINLPSLQF